MLLSALSSRRSTSRFALVAGVASAAAALTVTLMAPPAQADVVPPPLGQMAIDAAGQLDPSGNLARYTRETVAGANGPLLNPGPPAAAPVHVGCRPTPARPRPVIVVHGTFQNGGDISHSLGNSLRSRGFCVVTPTVGAYAGNPGRGGLDSIAGASGPQLASAIDTVRRVTGAGQVDLVGYSQGASIAGFTAKALRPGAVRNLVSVAGYWGADPVGLVPMEVPPLVAGAALTVVNLRGLAELVPGSPTMTAWNGVERSPFQHGTGYTLIASHNDPTVPPSRSFVPGPGVRHVVVQDGCGRNQANHGSMPFDARTQDHVANALGAGVPVRC